MTISGFMGLIGSISIFTVLGVIVGLVFLYSVFLAIYEYLDK